MLPVKADLTICSPVLAFLDSARVHVAFMLSYKLEFSSCDISYVGLWQIDVMLSNASIHRKI